MKKFNYKTWIKGLMLSCLLVVLMAGCGSEDKKIVVAEQYGIAYAPLTLMKEAGILEEVLGDDYQVEWVKLANMAAIREAMVADSLDVGFMGIPPFLIGLDNGMEWKIISGLSESPLGLVVNDPEITSLEELLASGKIALPQPGSIQHILLSMTAKDRLGDAKAFDNQLVSMKHPDGMMALLNSDEVVAHYTSPPYLFQELDEGSPHLLTKGTDGTKEDFTFIVGVCRESFYEDPAYEPFQEALVQCIDLINKRDKEAISILADAYELEVDTLLDYMGREGMSYGIEIKGLEKFMSFMVEEEYIKESYEEDQVIWK